MACKINPKLSEHFMHNIPRAVISGTGLYTPPHQIDNHELVASFNQYVDQFNQKNQQQIAAGELAALEYSAVEFIEKASGIKSRFVVDKTGILDPNCMVPKIAPRADDAPSIQCEMAVAAINEALANAGKTVADVDCVIVACSNLPRAYPALAIEIQTHMGIGGFAYDMNVACSSATFGINNAASLIYSGSARTVLMVNPEICSAHLNWRDRDSHFIFGDVCTAVVIENAETVTTKHAFEIIGSKLFTSFSNNIRNNFGFLNRAEAAATAAAANFDRLFTQNGRKVFKDVCPLVIKTISDHAREHGIAAQDLQRLWLHQANINMNNLIARKLLEREPSASESPNILDRYANTSSAGCVIALHQHSDDLPAGAIGNICSFGAGYSIGSVLLKKC